MDFLERFSGLLGNDRGAISRLAEAVGASTGLVSAWKAGDKKPSFEYIIKIAEYFSVTTDYLLCTSFEGDYSREGRLSETEELLLGLFRKLPDDLHRENVIGYVSGMLAVLPRYNPPEVKKGKKENPASL